MVHNWTSTVAKASSSTGERGYETVSEGLHAVWGRLRRRKKRVVNRPPSPPLPIPPPPPRKTEFFPGSWLNPEDRDVWDIVREPLGQKGICIPLTDLWENWPAQTATSPDVMLVKRCTPDTGVKDICVKLLPRGTAEMAIIQYLSSPEARARSTLSCPPIIDIIQPDEFPRGAVCVMPILKSVSIEELNVVADCLDFMRQALEGLIFLHSLGIAHLDIAMKNFMIVPSSKEACRQRHVFHAVHKHYCYIDFGQSVFYGPVLRKLHKDVSGAGLFAPPEVAAFRDSPEGEGYDPFPVDVWRLGLEFHVRFVIGKRNLAFLQSLTSDMIKEDPRDRPTAKQALRRLRQLIAPLQQDELQKTTLRPPPGSRHEEGW